MFYCTTKYIVYTEVVLGNRNHQLNGEYQFRIFGFLNDRDVKCKVHPISLIGKYKLKFQISLLQINRRIS